MGNEDVGDVCGRRSDLAAGMLGEDWRDVGVRGAPKPGGAWQSSLGPAGRCLAALCQQAWKLFGESSGMDCTASGSLRGSTCPSRSAWM